MALLDKLTKKNRPAAGLYQIDAYCFLRRDEELMNALDSNPKFELSTEELVKQGYAGKTIYKFYSEYKRGVTIIPEPTNPHDKNAVMIMLGRNFFGYVSREHAPVVLGYMKANCIESVSLQISGGPIRKIYATGQSMADRHEIAAKLMISIK